MTIEAENEWRTISKNDKKRIARRPKKKAALNTAKESQIQGPQQGTHVPASELERVISQCQLEIESTKFFAAIEEMVLRVPPPLGIVCYGIGNFGATQSTPSASLWQLAFALLLRNIFQKQGLEITMYYFEPFMTSEEEVLLEQLSIRIIRENERGKRVVTERTFFFMPHCPLVLYSNLLFENRDNLQNLVIVGNSLLAYANRLQKNCHTLFLQTLRPFWCETTVSIPHDEVSQLSAQFERAFNDQAVISFTDTQDLELSEDLVAKMIRESETSDEVV